MLLLSSEEAKGACSKQPLQQDNRALFFVSHLVKPATKPMKHFTINELCKSATATRLGINNTPPAAIVLNLRYLADMVLDPLRELYGKPIYVNCGYRCPELNKAVGGAENSQHLTGLAADIHVKGESNAVLYELAKGYCLPFDQLILEKGTIRSPQWVHISVSRTKNRGEVLHYNGKTYTKLN